MGRKPKYKRQPINRNRNNSAGLKRLIKGVLTLGAVFLLIIFFFGDHGIYQLYKVRTEKKQIQEQINQLRERGSELKAEKLRLETDYEYIERLARERYRMAKKGEKVFKVIKTPK